MKENWTDEIRRKLEGHEMSPPDGLWEGICEEMGFEQKATRRPMVNKRWWWVAAAAVVAMVGLFTLYHFGDDTLIAERDDSMMRPSKKEIPSKDENRMKGETPMEGTIIKNEISALTNGEEATPSAPIDAVNRHTRVQPLTSSHETQTAMVSSPVTKPQDLQKETVDEGKVTDGQTKKEERQLAKDEELQQTDEAQPSVAETKPAMNDKIWNGENYDRLENQQSSLVAHASHEETSKWTVGVNASGGLFIAQNTDGSQRLFFASKAPSPMYVGMSSFNYGNQGYSSYSNVTREAKHDIPMRFGVGVQYRLNDRWALLSGFNYTLLRSRFSLPLYDLLLDNQRLHYAGIPVKLVYQLLSNQHLRLYLSGGGMAEKCLNAKPWQWSVNAAAGVEYAITPLVGCYAEPSLGYFFDDGSSLEHYYKEHPVAPAIELGVRLHVPYIK